MSRSTELKELFSQIALGAERRNNLYGPLVKKLFEEGQQPGTVKIVLGESYDNALLPPASTPGQNFVLSTPNPVPELTEASERASTVWSGLNYAIHHLHATKVIIAVEKGFPEKDENSSIENIKKGLKNIKKGLDHHIEEPTVEYFEAKDAAIELNTCADSRALGAHMGIKSARLNSSIAAIREGGDKAFSGCSCTIGHAKCGGIAYAIGVIEGTIKHRDPVLDAWVAQAEKPVKEALAYAVKAGLDKNNTAEKAVAIWNARKNENGEALHLATDGKIVWMDCKTATLETALASQEVVYDPSASAPVAQRKLKPFTP